MRNKAKEQIEKNYRRYPKPLPMPVFGTPYDGVKCPSCDRWFSRRSYWRQGRVGRYAGHYVKRCKECIDKNR